MLPFHAVPRRTSPRRHSEQRAVELLDNLCGHMRDYTLVTVTHNDTGKKTVHWAKYQGDGAADVTKVWCHGGVALWGGGGPGVMAMWVV